MSEHYDKKKRFDLARKRGIRNQHCLPLLYGSAIRIGSKWYDINGRCRSYGFGKWQSTWGNSSGSFRRHLSSVSWQGWRIAAFHKSWNQFRLQAKYRGPRVNFVSQKQEKQERAGARSISMIFFSERRKRKFEEIIMSSISYLLDENEAQVSNCAHTVITPTYSSISVQRIQYNRLVQLAQQRFCEQGQLPQATNRHKVPLVII